VADSRTAAPAQAAVEGAPAQSQVRAQLANDRKALGAEKANVFGIELGEPLSMPVCEQGLLSAMSMQVFEDGPKNALTTSPNTCLQPPNAITDRVASRIANIEGLPLGSDVRVSLVRLASERCPTWVSGGCTLATTTKSGVVIGVSFLTTGNSDKDVEASIAKKYGQPPTARKPATCQNNASAQYGLITRQGTDRIWQLGSLTVGFWPVNGLTCQQGRVLVETRLMTQLVQQSLQQQKASEPTM
jgi:hypothetical protein